MHRVYLENFILWEAFGLTTWRDDDVWRDSLLVGRWRNCLDLLDVCWCWRRWEPGWAWGFDGHWWEPDAARDWNAGRHFSSGCSHWYRDFSHFTAHVSWPIAGLELMTVHQSTCAAFQQGAAEHADIVETAVCRMCKVSELLGATEVWRWRWRGFWVKAQCPARRTSSWTLISSCLCICKI